jgi:hypothetical protein
MGQILTPANFPATQRMPNQIEIESESECSRQTAFSSARGTDGAEKFVGISRFLSCVSRLRCGRDLTQI